MLLQRCLSPTTTACRGVRAAVIPFLLGGGFLLCLAAPVVATDTKQVLGVEEKSLRQGQASQERIDTMSDEAARLLHRYREVTQRADSLMLYNDNLEEITRSQEAEISSFERQLAGIEETRREIVPFKLLMLTALEGFIARDLPFLADERKARVEGLHNLVERADITVAEKYRRIMEAYQQEVNYNLTIETYSGTLDDDNDARNVEFLRIGRLAYLYQTPDRRESGFWHPQRRRWQPLGQDYHQHLRRGILVADRRIAPELIRIPVVISQPREDQP